MMGIEDILTYGAIAVLGYYVAKLILDNNDRES
jgi:hypothetical protein